MILPARRDACYGPVSVCVRHKQGCMVWYGMVNVDLYSAIITKVSNALGTLVSGEKPGFVVGRGRFFDTGDASPTFLD